MRTLWFSAIAAVFFFSAPTAMAGTPDVSQAEYVRLSAELQKLAVREAWAGVEATYSMLLETDQDLRFRDHFTGAQAASMLGDVTSARERLMKANTLGESRDAIEWLWTIDSTYTPVQLTAEEGVELRPLAMPFNPHEAKAVHFAMDQISESGDYTGLLPPGTYVLGTTHFEVARGGDKVEAHGAAPVVDKKKKKSKSRS